ncbi:MAG: hypothetical protein G01um1014106_226, partial [Parcubacteria group bacterium Gr01-1014_106]
FVLGFRGHPGERPESSEEKELYADALQRRSDILADVPQIDARAQGFENPHYIGAAHLTAFAGGPNESFTAAWARCLGVYVYDKYSRIVLTEQGAADGKWYVAEKQGLHVVDAGSGEAVERMIEAFRTLQSSEGAAELHRMQEENFPLPRTWDTVGEDLEVIEAVTEEREPILKQPQ